MSLARAVSDQALSRNLEDSGRLSEASRVKANSKTKRGVLNWMRTGQCTHRAGNGVHRPVRFTPWRFSPNPEVPLTRNPFLVPNPNESVTSFGGNCSDLIPVQKTKGA